MISRAVSEYSREIKPPDTGWFEDALQRYVLVESTDDVADLLAHPRVAIMKRTQWVNARQNVIIGYDKKNKPVRLPSAWMADPRRLSAYSTMYYPNDQRIFMKDGVNYYNTYVPPDLKPADPWDKDKCELIFNHINYMFKGDRIMVAHFLKWMAFTVRYPAIRIPWAPLLISSTQGVGKGRLFLLLEHLLGKENCRQIVPSNLTETQLQFNEWMGFALLWIDELDPKWDFYDRLKPIITEPRCIINNKYGKKEHREIFCNVIMTTNHAAALRVPKQDRRIFVIDADVELLEPEYYTQVHDWIMFTDGPAHFLGYLNELDLKDFKFAAPPPVTQAKKVMIEGSRSEIDRCITNAIELHSGPFANDIIDNRMACNYVMSNLKIDSLSWHEQKHIGEVLRKAVKKLLPQEQYTITLPNGLKERRRLVAVRNSEAWVQKSREKIVEQYLKGREEFLI
jgi:hypothetical protein